MKRREFLESIAGGAAASRAGGTPPPGAVGPGDDLTAIHTMLDMPEWSPDNGRHWDPEKYIRLAKRAQVGFIELKTKNAMGHAMFPFKGRPCPKDWTTRTRALAKEAGIRFIAYYNVGLDNWMARQHPEWACVDANGRKEMFAAFNWMCIRSPWRDVVLNELGQVEEAIRPDGVWFDLLGTPNAYGLGSFDPARACFCPYCREAYKQAFGEEQPAGSSDPEIRLRVNRFGNAARVAMLRDACNLVRSIDPKVWLGYNHAGPDDDMLATPKDVQDLITFHSAEAKQHRPISLAAKAMWALGKPYQVHSWGGFNRMEPGAARGTWSAWNVLPPSYLKVSAAIATAHGGRISVGVNPNPDGTVYEGEFQNLAQTFAEVRKREPWLAGLESVPNIAVVYDWRSELDLLPLPGGGSMPIRQEAMGLHDALLDAGMHFDVINADRLAPERYRAILLGDALCPSAELGPALERFVAAGGLLIATHETSLRDRKGKRLEEFAWADLLGVRFTGVSPYQEANFGWLGEELRADAPAYPVLFRTPVLEIACTSAKPLAELVYPAAHRTPEVFTDGETPYTHFQRFTGKPLMAANRVGKGWVVYIAAPIGREISARGDPWLKRIISCVVKEYATGLAVEVEAPPGIQAVFGRRAKGGSPLHVLSLVNHYGGLNPGTGPYALPNVGPVHVRIPTSGISPKPKSVRALGAEGVDWKFTAEALAIRIASVGHHAVLAIV
jgi:hypothetical protein